MRLDRFLIRRNLHSCKEIAERLKNGHVSINGEVETSGLRRVDRFTCIELEGEILQAETAIYLMLHKPAGYLSATQDLQHPTVIELIDHSLRDTLHLAGRLDRASSGLLLLTNDGRWSKQVTEPRHKIAKVYRVTTRDTIAADTIAKFEQGIYFSYENLTTRPAKLEILADRSARLTIHEGRYHQVKRMFHAVGNQVLSLHRESIGSLVLGSLAVGESRLLLAHEINQFQD